MSVVTPNDTYPVVTPSSLPMTLGASETGISLPKDDFAYNSVPIAVAGTLTVRYARGEDSRPIPYPTEAE